MNWTLGRILRVSLVVLLLWILCLRMADPVRVVNNTSESVVKLMIVKKEPIGLEDLEGDDSEDPQPKYQDVPHLCAGYIADNFGHVVTAAHCVEGGDKIVSIKVYLRDSDEAYTGQIVLVRHILDVALLKVPGLPKGLPYLRSKEDYILPGRRVYAIGHPLGLFYSVSSGIISGYRSRPADISNPDAKDWVGFLQSDTPINPGNSGGPLVDEQGEVVGVCSFMAIAPWGTPAAGLGFWVPSTTVNIVMKGFLNRN